MRETSVDIQTMTHIFFNKLNQMKRDIKPKKMNCVKKVVLINFSILIFLDCLRIQNPNINKKPIKKTSVIFQEKLVLIGVAL